MSVLWVIIWTRDRVCLIKDLRYNNHTYVLATSLTMWSPKHIWHLGSVCRISLESEKCYFQSRDIVKMKTKGNSNSPWFLLFCLVSSGALQATRALMIVGILVTVAGLGVATMGMKCTNCGGEDKTKKSRIAMTGGIILLIGGEPASIVVLFRNSLKPKHWYLKWRFVV